MEATSIETRPAESATKRRSGKRTARACDECRMRKAKCDGLQPCESCQTTDRYCTYNLSASRSTGSGTRIRILEDRLRRARAYLNEAQRRTPSLAGVNFDALLGPMDEYSGSDQKTDSKAFPQSEDNNGDDAAAAALDDDDVDDDDKLHSMMDAYGQMTVNSHDNMARDFYGAASGLAFIQKTKDMLHLHNGKSPNSDESPSDLGNSATVQLFDAPLPPKQALHLDTPLSQLLPPRPVANRLVSVVFTQVYPLFHFLCAEHFDESTDRIYDKPSADYDEIDYSFLPLFYVVVGLGYLFSREEHDKYGCRNAIAQGVRHFVAGRMMLDIAHLRTLASLQSVVSLILFLISTARIASAHAFVGVACAAAMRQGLHYRSTHEAEIPLSERKVRRRVFWAVMNLDMYVSSILGLPPFMDLSAVDPALDTTIELALSDFHNSEEKTAELLAMAASAKHIELLRIIFKAQRTLFPKPHDPPESTTQAGTITVSVPQLRKVESQFQEWAKSLVEIHSYPGTTDEIISLKYEIQVCYYFGHIVLYRTFLHYIGRQQDVSKRQREYADTCIKMASRVVSLSINHQQQGLLCPASWPSLYTVFISTICLIFAYVITKDTPDEHALRKDIENGIRLLACTACSTDTGSVRCLEILRRLISRVSDRIEIDVDEICNSTKPCCTTNFNPSAERAGVEPDNPINLRPPSRRVDSTSRSSVSSWLPSDLGADSIFSPDPTMTQPSFSQFKYVSPPAAAHSGTQHGSGEETMEIDRFAENFTWPPGMYSSASERSGSHETQAQQQQPQQRASPGSSRLTPRDLANFMRINSDDNFRSQN